MILKLKGSSNKFLITSNEVEPKTRYSKENPKRSKQEENEPKTKYFSPASIE